MSDDSFDMGDPLGVIGDRLLAHNAAGLRLLRTEALSPRKLMTLSELVALLRRVLPPMSDREDRRIMTYLSLLDTEGQGTTTLAAFLEAVQLPAADTQPSRTQSRQNPAREADVTPSFMRYAKSAYNQLLQATDGSDSDATPVGTAFGFRAEKSAHDLFSHDSGEAPRHERFPVIHAPPVPALSAPGKVQYAAIHLPRPELQNQCKR